MTGSKRAVLRNPVVSGEGTLPHEEQMELFRQMRPPYAPATMAAARETLILCNTPLARSRARAWAQKTGREFGPLLSHATVGLIDAVDRFRPELGFRFSTFARHYLDGYIVRGDGDERGVIRLPAWVREKHRYQADTEFGRAARRARGASSLEPDDVATEQDGPDCGDREVVAGAVAAAVAALPERLGTVVRLRYGLGCEPRTLAEVGEVVGVTRERARQLEYEAEQALRYRLDRLKPEGARDVPACGTCGGPTDGYDGAPCPPCREAIKAEKARRAAEKEAEARKRARAVAGHCVECGTTGGRAKKEGWRPSRVRGMCMSCYESWLWDRKAAERAAAKAARRKTEGPKTAAPCVVCGTTGGGAPVAGRKPVRALGRCLGCYTALQVARRSAARAARREARKEAAPC